MAIAEKRSVTPDISQIRAQFPSLASGFAYLENAGGSQVPGVVADAIREYMLTTYVQTGAGYPQSDAAGENINRAHAFANTFMGGDGFGDAILGPSTTSLLHTIANAYSFTMPAGTRIIAAETGHEANIGCWADLAKRGFDFQSWKIDPETLQCPLDALEKLLKEKPTKIVAMTHVSNLLGEIIDVKPAIDLAHRYGARVVLDGVAYAPHRAIDVKALDADYYVFSWYKVYAPHMACLFASHDAIAEIEGPNHFFIPKNYIPYKFQLGGISHEACAGLNGMSKYLSFLAGRPEDIECNRQAILEAFQTMEALELPIQKHFIDFLKSKPNVRIIGPQHGERGRVPTISFLHKNLAPPEIVAKVHEHPIGIRYGDAYAYRLCQALGIDTKTGVVRASFVHYNTLDEIDRLCTALDKVL